MSHPAYLVMRANAFVCPATRVAVKAGFWVRTNGTSGATRLGPFDDLRAAHVGAAKHFAMMAIELSTRA